MTTLVFPGQGSQFIGMSKDFYDNFNVAKQVFEIIENSTKIPLKKIIFENKDNLLDITQFTQISIFCASMAIYRVFESLNNQNKININCSLGHSLGEYSSLVSSKVLSIEDCSMILKVRGELMQNAYEKNQSGMAAIIGLNCKQLEDIINENNLDVEIANDNSPLQVVISGTVKNLNTSEQIILKNGAKKFVELKVSAAFHSKIMIEAEKKFISFLEKIKFKNANYPIISNYTGSATSESNKIFQNISKQMSNRVRWTESIQNLEKIGGKKIIEIGPGKVLSGLIKRISNNFDIISINSVKDMEDLFK
tara:strand:+ start:1144 stop:2067 length:924 start_codon:yes stop_codon:yes gene_type:complete